MRAGANTLRYRIHHKLGFLALINDVNGYIRNSHRLVQLSKICDKYELNLKYPPSKHKPAPFGEGKGGASRWGGKGGTDKLTYNNG